MSLRLRLIDLHSSAEAAPRPPDSGLAAAILDPYVNALHTSLLRENRLNPAYAKALADLGAGGREIPLLRERLWPKDRKNSSGARSCSSFPTPNRFPGCIARPGCVPLRNWPPGGSEPSDNTCADGGGNKINMFLSVVWELALDKPLIERLAFFVEANCPIQFKCAPF